MITHIRENLYTETAAGSSSKFSLTVTLRSSLGCEILPWTITLTDTCFRGTYIFETSRKMGEGLSSSLSTMGPRRYV